MFDKIFKPKKISLPNGKTVLQKRSRVPLIIIALIICIAISVDYTNFKISTIFTDGYKFFDIIIDMIPPTWEYLSNIWDPLMDTIKMSLFGSLIGAALEIGRAHV